LVEPIKKINVAKPAHSTSISFRASKSSKKVFLFRIIEKAKGLIIEFDILVFSITIPLPWVTLITPIISNTLIASLKEDLLISNIFTNSLSGGRLSPTLRFFSFTNS